MEYCCRKTRNIRICSDRGSRFDELHVVVIDGEGKITGNSGTILEKHLNLSKAKDATFSAGSPRIGESYLQSNSEYIFGGGAPSGVAALDLVLDLLR